MLTYRVRPATIDDVDALIRHRIGMFTDMGLSIDVEAITRTFSEWLAEMMPAGTYRAWIADIAGGEIVAGAGITILPWPPGPMSLTGRMAFVYNVYTEPPYRSRGLGRTLMESIHGWCRQNGIDTVGLNASTAGQRLYESMGYHATASPMMFLALK